MDTQNVNDLHWHSRVGETEIGDANTRSNVHTVIVEAVCTFDCQASETHSRSGITKASQMKLNEAKKQIKLAAAVRV